MATLALQITPQGATAPDYDDILQQLKIGTWSIFGNDAILDNDSQDGQLLAIFAKAIYDTNQSGRAVYNSFSPATAQGAGLSSVVKINGIQRLVASNSSVVLTIVGQAGTTITNGIVGDNLNLNTQWALPASVIIPLSGTIDVTAVCTVAGAVTAAADSLTQLLTPTRGWQTSNNANEAIVGAPVESDATLRQRQSKSTALPAQTILEAIYANVANIAGVQRLFIYQNDTDTTDGNGIPSHSISAVVSGGDAVLICTAIAEKKSPGTGTYGSTSETIVDQNGTPDTINFYPLAQISLKVEIDLTMLTGYVDTTDDLIKAALAAFVDGYDIGEDSYLTRLYTPANLGGTGIGATFRVTAIKQSIKPAAVAVQDITIAFNQAAVLVVTDITLVKS